MFFFALFRTLPRRAFVWVMALVVLAAPALAADSCGQPGFASASSTLTWGLQGMAVTFQQDAKLQQLSGEGTDGDWIMTEWTVETTLPMADPLAATRGGMLPVPEWNAQCSGKALTSTTFLSECLGEVPLVVENGVIAWVKGGKPIGRITAGPAGQPAEMILNVLPNEGGFDWTMTGTATGASTPKLDAQLTAGRNFSNTSGDLAGREYELHIAVTPATTELIKAIDAGFSHTGFGLASMSAATETVIGRKFLLRIHGPTAHSRKSTTDSGTIDAAIKLNACHVSELWSLKALIAKAGYTP